MNHLKEKFKLIFIPFLLIAAGFILTYSFLHWLLIIKGGLSIKEDLVKFWLPFGLPVIPILIWLNPKMKLLQFKKDNGSFGIQFLAVLAIALPTIIAQEYLITATGKLTSLDHISNIEKVEKTKYYTLRDCYIDKQNISVQNTATVTGKNNTDFNILIYIALPILNDEQAVSTGECSYWLGKKYSKTISNHKSDDEKNAIFKTFADKCQQEFDTTNFKQFQYLEVLGNTEDHDEFNNAINKSKLLKYKNPIVFKAIMEPYENKNGSSRGWTFGSLAIGGFIWFIILLFLKFDEEKLSNYMEGKVEQDNDIRDFFSFFLPKEGFYITPIIMDLNILVFLVMVFSGLGFVSFKAHDLLSWGANYKPMTENGEWWRLLTSTFLHGGLMHLLANMYGLLFVGTFLEPILGKSKYAIIYLVTGILASIASLWWHDNTVSVGASGAIFGLYGFFLAALLLKVFPPDFGKAFLASTLVFIGFNLLMGFAGGIDNAAHIGGLVSGFIIGAAMSGQLKRNASE